MRDWDIPRRRFIENGESLRRIAEETGIPYSSLAQKAKAEDWRGRRAQSLDEENSARLERLTKKLLDQIEAALSSEEGLDAKDFKAVTGALRELNDICGERAQKTGPGELTVRFVGDAEEYSR